MNHCNKVMLNLCYSGDRTEDTIQFTLSVHNSLIFRSIWIALHVMSVPYIKFIKFTAFLVCQWFFKPFSWMKSEDQTNLYPLKTNALKSKTDVKVPAAYKRHARHKYSRGGKSWCISNGPVAFLSFQLKNTLWKHCAAKNKSDYMIPAVLGPHSK